MPSPSDSATDRLGLDPYAKALVTFLLKPCPNPDAHDADAWPARSISIEGGWGVGKSTFADRVTQLLRDKGVPVVTFRPWVHADSGDLWQALASEFHAEVKQHLSFADYWKRMAKLLGRHGLFWGPDLRRPRLLAIAGLIFASLTIPSLLWMWAFVPDTLTPAIDLGERMGNWLLNPIPLIVAALPAMAFSWKFILPKTFAGLQRIARGPGQAPFVSTLQGDFERLVNALCPPGNPRDRAVIFIDDLDRCDHIGVAETLRAIGVLLNEKVNVTIVLAIDRDRVAATLAGEDGAIELHASLDEQVNDSSTDQDSQKSKDADLTRRKLRQGHLYLEKFIEATFRLPAFGPNQTNRLFNPDLPPSPRAQDPDTFDIGTHWKTIQNQSDYARQVFRKNPRRIRIWQRDIYLQLLTFHALNRLAPAQPNPDQSDKETVTADQIARVNALLIAWPSLIADWRKQPNLFEWMAWAAHDNRLYASSREFASWFSTKFRLRGTPLTEAYQSIGRILDRPGIETLLDETSAQQTADSESETKPALARLKPLLLLDLQEPLDACVVKAGDTNGDLDRSTFTENADPQTDASEHPPAMTETTTPRAQDFKSQIEAELEPEAERTQESDVEPPPRPDPEEHSKLDLTTEEGLRAIVPEAALKDPESSRRRRGLERAAKALKQEGSNSLAYANALMRIGRNLYEAAEYVPAEIVFAHIIEVQQQHPAIDDADRATAINLHGQALFQLGQLDEALDAHHQAEHIRRKVFGDEHLSVAQCLNNRGMVLRDLGRLDEALDAYQEAERIICEDYGNEHRDAATAASNRATVLRDLGRLDEALEIYQQSERVHRRSVGHEHHNIAVLLNNRGNVLRDLGRLDEAFDAHRHAERIDRQALGDQHPYVVLNEATCLYMEALLHPRRRDTLQYELTDRLYRMLELVPSISRYPVIIGRYVRELGGDPVSVVREREGDAAAKTYANLLDGPRYPDGPRRKSPPPDTSETPEKDTPASEENP